MNKRKKEELLTFKERGKKDETRCPPGGFRASTSQKAKRDRKFEFIARFCFNINDSAPPICIIYNARRRSMRAPRVRNW